MAKLDDERYREDDHRDGSYYEKQAAKYSEKCSSRQNAQRQENGRRPNVSGFSVLDNYKIAPTKPSKN